VRELVRAVGWLALAAAYPAQGQAARAAPRADRPTLAVDVYFDASDAGRAERVRAARGLLLALAQSDGWLPQVNCTLTHFGETVGQTIRGDCAALAARLDAPDVRTHLSSITSLLTELGRRAVAQPAAAAPVRHVKIIVSDFDHDEDPSDGDPSDLQDRNHWRDWEARAKGTADALAQSAGHSRVILAQVPEAPGASVAKDILRWVDSTLGAGATTESVAGLPTVSEVRRWVLRAIRPVTLELSAAPAGCAEVRATRVAAWFPLPLGDLAWPVVPPVAVEQQPMAAAQPLPACIHVRCPRHGHEAREDGPLRCDGRSDIRTWTREAGGGCALPEQQVAGLLPGVGCDPRDATFTMVLDGVPISRPTSLRPMFTLERPRLLLFPGTGHQAELQQDLQPISVPQPTRLTVSIYSAPRGTGIAIGDRPQAARQLGTTQCIRLEAGSEYPRIRLLTLVHQDDLQDGLPTEVLATFRLESPAAMLSPDRTRTTVASEIVLESAYKVETCFHPRFKTLVRSLVVVGLVLGGLVQVLGQRLKLEALGVVLYFLMGPLLAASIPASSLTSEYVVDLLISLEHLWPLHVVWCFVAEYVGRWKWGNAAWALRNVAGGLLAVHALLYLVCLVWRRVNREQRRLRQARLWPDRPWRGSVGRHTARAWMLVAGLAAGAHSIHYVETNQGRGDQPLCNLTEADPRGEERRGPPLCGAGDSKVASRPDDGRLREVKMGCPP
jgi:hypothetical protein